MGWQKKGAASVSKLFCSYVYDIGSSKMSCNLQYTYGTAVCLQSAKAIKKLCDVLGESLSAHHQKILNSLLKELPGRFWEVTLHYSSYAHGTI